MDPSNMSLYLTPSEVQLVDGFLESHRDNFRLAAMNRLDKYPAMAVLVKIIKQIRGQTLLDIVDSHLTKDILSDVKILRSSHGATGPWLDEVERLLSKTGDDDNIAYFVMRAEILQYESRINALTKVKDKIEARLDELRIHYGEIVRLRTELTTRRTTMENLVILPGDDLPVSD